MTRISTRCDHATRGGRAGHDKAPVFSDTMQYLVFRPYWEVPSSITRGELIPHIARDPYYLSKKAPATEFFAKSRRDFSHGCIRLEHPADLAASVLRDNPGWTPDRIRAAMNGSTTQQVNLAHPIPVLIVYGTVVVLEDGVVHFYDDIYGHDAALEKVLVKGYPYPW